MGMTGIMIDVAARGGTAPPPPRWTCPGSGRDAPAAGGAGCRRPRRRSGGRAWPAAPGPHQAVAVIRHEGPGGEGEVRRPGHFPQSAEDVRAVRGVPDNGAAFNPAHPAVVEGVGGIPARAAGHRGGTGAESNERRNVPDYVDGAAWGHHPRRARHPHSHRRLHEILHHRIRFHGLPTCRRPRDELKSPIHEFKHLPSKWSPVPFFSRSA
jgi:hypothetical protein